MKQKRIAIIATLDTKGEEGAYIKSLIAKRGHIPLLIDAGVFRSQYSSVSDISNEKVIESLEPTMQKSMQKIRSSETMTGAGEHEAISLMTEGVSTVVKQLLAERKIDGLISIGGSMGTSLALKVMQNIPITIPKLMLTPMAFTPIIPSGFTSIDQIMMQTIADPVGLNQITKMTIKRAVGVICGAAEEQDELIKEKPVVGITGLGGHRIVALCRSLLKEKGYEPINFTAVGTNAMERLITEGFVDGVIDLTVYDLATVVCGAAVKGGEEKYIAGCRKGIPQVITPGGIDYFGWAGTVDTLPPEYKKRNIHQHNPMVIMIPTIEEERTAVLNQIIERVNQARERTFLLIPLRGFSRVDKEGMPFYIPGGGKKVFDTLKRGITNNRVEVVEIDAHINDPIFGETAVRLLEEAGLGT